jgi:sugar O-acyltransferase (sialic acid O-acetyltransferase NeuD family)
MSLSENNQINLVFIGAGEAFQEIYPIICDCNNNGENFQIVGLLDDDVAKHGRLVEGFEVLGGLELAKEMHDVKFVFGIGSYRSRKIRNRLISKMNRKPSDFVNIIHPSANIYPGVSIGQGLIIYPGVTVCHGATLSDFTIITFDAIIGPKVFLGKFSMVASQSLILTAAQVGLGSFIGGRCVIAEGVIIGDYSVVVMGSVVFCDIPANSIAQGNPAKRLM